MITKLCLICTFLCAVYTTDAQSGKLLAIADSLLLNKQYFESSIVYERVLFESKEQAEIYTAVTGKLKCLKKQEKYAEAVRFVNSSISSISSDSLKYILYREEVTCSYLAGNFENALSVIESVKANFSNHQNDTWLTLVKILSLNELRRWQEAALLYNDFLVQSSFTGKEVYADLYTILPKQKSEDKAAWLSTFIPGAGQLYAGKPFEALASLTIQAAGLYYGIISFRDKYYLSAIFAGAGIFGSFHNGGVKRSQELVKQYNTKKADVFNERARQKLIAIFEKSNP